MTAKKKISAKPAPESAPLTAPNPSTRWIAVALFVITAVVYAPVTTFQFVNYDDTDFVTANPIVQAGFTTKGFMWAWTSEVARNWHPVTMFSHMFDCWLFKLQPWWPHLVNALLHATNTALLFMLLSRLTGAIWRSATVAALFALHPMHVESVAWVSERKDVLSTLFWFLTALAYGRYAMGGPKRGWFYGLSLVLCALGLMSKPMLVTLPFTLLLLDFWPLKRMASLAAIPKLVLEKVPFLILSAALCVITFRIQKEGGAVLGLESFSLGSRIGNSLVSYLRYIEKMFWPHDLAALYLRHGEWPVWIVSISALVLLAITGVVLTQWRQRPWLTVGWLWYAGTLVPVAGFVQVGMQAMADRYTYVPFTGLFVILVWGGFEVLERGSATRFAPGLSVAALVVLAGLTVHQEFYWKDSEALFKRMIDATPDNYMARYNLGNFYSRQQRTTEAISNLTIAVEEEPNYAAAHNNLGALFLDQKRFDEAVEQYRTALRINSDYLYEFNLANALADTASARHDSNLFNEAVSTYRKALDMNPGAALTHFNLALTLQSAGRATEALGEFEQTVKLDPDKVDAWVKIGIIDSTQGRMPEAERAFREIIRLQPANSDARGWLGNALAEQGKFTEAIPSYEASLKLNPNDSRTEFNLALTYMKIGKQAEAADHFRQALRIDPNYREAQAALQQLNAPR